jgi:hypothetical protein
MYVIAGLWGLKQTATRIFNQFPVAGVICQRSGSKKPQGSVHLWRVDVTLKDGQKGQTLSPEGAFNKSSQDCKILTVIRLCASFLSLDLMG